MDTRKFFIVIVLLALIVVLSFVPFNDKREIIIKAPLYDVAKEVNDLNNWKKWKINFNSKALKITGNYSGNQSAILNSGESYLLHHINPLTTVLTRKLKHNSTSSIIKLAPSTDNLSTYIIWTENVTIFNLIGRSFIKTNSRLANLESLKKLMEDVNYRYGFFIRVVPVKDTLILTAQTELIDNNSTHIVTYLYNLLQSFIKENNLPAEKKYFYKTILSDKKIAVGIPVYKKADNSKDIKFLQLPGSGRLVEGMYSGDYSNKQKIYTALNNFMLDQHLKQVAQPLEQYNVADTIINANINLNIKIFYPVF